MQHRKTERGGWSTTRLSSLACLVALVLSTLMVLSSPADATPGSGGSNGQASDNSCNSSHAADRPGSPCSTGSYGGALGGIDATPIAEQLLSSVAKSAGSKIGGELAGWALESIFGPTPDSNKEILDQLNELQGQITKLQSQVKDLADTVIAQLRKLMTDQQQTAFDAVAAQLTTDAGTLAAYQVRFDVWLKQKPGAAVDANQSLELQAMRGSLDKIIQHLNLAMVGAPGSRGLIGIYRAVVASQTAYPTDRFLTSEFTTPMSKMLHYYEGLATQAFTMLAEVNHLTWTDRGTTFPADNGIVEAYADLVPQMLAHWNQLATDGAGQLPDDVVADTQTGLLWSQSSLSLTGTKAFCWTACGANLSLSTQLTPDTVIDGLSGWSVPSQAQFTALASGQGTRTFAFLAAHGFRWQQEGPSATVNGLRITAPAYWSAGGTTVSFAVDGALHVYDQNHWPFFVPGPGAVAVRPMG